MPAAELRPISGKAGAYMLDGEEISIWEWSEGWRYDTICMVGSGAGGLIVSGQKWDFFGEQTKNDIDRNIAQRGRLSRGEEMIINSIGLFIGNRTASAATLVGSEVFHFLAERCYLEFKIDKDVVAEGPLLEFQSGLGVAGYSNDVAPAANILSNGVPSLSAVRPLLVNQKITSDNDLAAKVVADDAAWITGVPTPSGVYVFATVASTASVLVKLMLGGYIKSAVGRN